jgi:uncharacterized LabA/DUF88 family protein
LFTDATQKYYSGRTKNGQFFERRAFALARDNLDDAVGEYYLYGIFKFKHSVLRRGKHTGRYRHYSFYFDIKQSKVSLTSARGAKRMFTYQAHLTAAD